MVAHYPFLERPSEYRVRVLHANKSIDIERRCRTTSKKTGHLGTVGIHTHTHPDEKHPVIWSPCETRVSVQTARAAETIQHMHYCDATKTGTDRSRRSDAALLRALAILASIFDGYCRSQGRGGRRNMGLWGGGVWYTTTRMNYNNHNHDSYGSMHV